MSLNSRASIWVILLIVLFTVLVYSGSLKNSFIWDDSTAIVNNRFIKSWENFPRLFNRSYLTRLSDMDYLGKRDIGSGDSSYRPVSTLTYFIDYSIWKINPFGYHLTNLFLHVTNVILLFFLISFIADSRKIGLLASLLFAVHPVNAEAVNVAALRSNLLFFCFFLVSFILFIKSREYVGRKKVYVYMLSLASFFLALFSKETAMIFPLILLSYDYLLNKRAENTLANFKKYYFGYLGVLIFYVIIRFFVISSIINPLIAYPMRDIFTNVFTMLRVWLHTFNGSCFPLISILRYLMMCV